VTKYPTEKQDSVGYFIHSFIFLDGPAWESPGRIVKDPEGKGNSELR
jgi:hypothetical protein